MSNDLESREQDRELLDPDDELGGFMPKGQVAFMCRDCGYDLRAHKPEAGRLGCPSEEEARAWWGR